MATKQVKSEILIVGGRKQHRCYLFNPITLAMKECGELPPESRETSRFNLLPVRIDASVFLIN
jgi:hypothetical protein